MSNQSWSSLPGLMDGNILYRLVKWWANRSVYATPSGRVFYRRARLEVPRESFFGAGRCHFATHVAQGFARYLA
jgi:hypothetical protein